MKTSRAIAVLFAVLAIAATHLFAAPIIESKPKAAFFPLGGDADEKLRDKVAFSLRTKLDADGHYEVLDGFRMKDLAADAKAPIDFTTDAVIVQELSKVMEVKVIVWGDLNTRNEVRLKILDLREKQPQPHEYKKTIAQPTDLRFIAEAILQSLPGVEKFEHPSEVAVTDDATAKELWVRNPNLLKNGDFSQPGGWTALYMSEKYIAEIKDQLPQTNKVCIYRQPGEKAPPGEKGQPANNVLAMSLNKECAENNGMACLSDAFPIQPNTRYRISFRYKSDGPSLHVFVKGYTTGEDIKGQKADREVYRRQVPPTGPTAGKWVTVVDDLNPQHTAFPVERLKVDLYAYLGEGHVMFDDIVIKAVGAQTHIAKDDALPILKK